MSSSAVELLRARVAVLAPVKGQKRPRRADSWSKVARDVKCAFNTIKGFALGRTTPQGDLLMALFKRFRLDSNTGKSTKEVPDLDLLPPDSPAGIWLAPHDGRVCAGPGTGPTDPVYAHHEKEKMERVPAWMCEEALRHRSSKLWIVDLAGDSMQPFYHPGDQLLLELLVDPGEYRAKDHVVVDKDGTGNYVLRIYFPREHVLTAMDVNKHGSIPITEATKFFGRVVATIRRME